MTENRTTPADAGMPDEEPITALSRKLDNALRQLETLKTCNDVFIELFAATWALPAPPQPHPAPETPRLLVETVAEYLSRLHAQGSLSNSERFDADTLLQDVFRRAREYSKPPSR